MTFREREVSSSDLVVADKLPKESVLVRESPLSVANRDTFSDPDDRVLDPGVSMTLSGRERGRTSLVACADGKNLDELIGWDRRASIRSGGRAACRVGSSVATGSAYH